MRILRVAIPVPLRQLFDYLPVPDAPDLAYQPGQRVLAPFGNRRLPGIVVAITDHPERTDTALKPLLAVLDATPLIPADILALAGWAARYYHAPPGEALAAVLPGGLRQGASTRQTGTAALQLTAAGQQASPGDLRRAPRQAALLARLQAAGSPLPLDALKAEGYTGTVLRALLQRGLAEAGRLPVGAAEPVTTPPAAGLPTPNTAQRTAIAAITGQLGRYACFLLEGITGSGKTEVYLQAIAAVLARDGQALVLVPEIGLTPQTVQRFRERFGERVACYHSGLGEREREQAWQDAASGRARVLIGTRSAVFIPLPEAGILVIDEEHDAAFKQQEGFRYHARDVAIKRAFDRGIPVLLGSATPSAESLAHALEGRYRHLHLPERAGHAALPAWRLIDTRHQVLDEGFSAPLLQALQHTLQAGHQALLFINRRGYAPSLLCHDCGWHATCPHCSARLTLHSRPPGLRCHHCDSRSPRPSQCPRCHSHALLALGAGTQRSEQALARLFPQFPVLRIDRDSTRNRQSMEQLLAPVNAGQPCLLVGTQMLAKGHHFPHVTLVGVLDADQGLFTADFRGPERMGQLLMQVAGRAGRGNHPGEVLIQTHLPEHPWLLQLIQGGYRPFITAVLEERRRNGLPPFGHLALLRAEAEQPGPPERLLREARQACPLPAGTRLIGPLPAMMERKAGRYRFLLLLASHERGLLHAALDALVPAVEAAARRQRLRWGVDVDPVDMP